MFVSNRRVVLNPAPDEDFLDICLLHRSTGLAGLADHWLARLLLRTENGKLEVVWLKVLLVDNAAWGV